MGGALRIEILIMPRRPRDLAAYQSGIVPMIPSSKLRPDDVLDGALVDPRSASSNNDHIALVITATVSRLRM